jgi:excisionase family DNA binding protein
MFVPAHCATAEDNMTDKIAHSIDETAHRIGVSRSFLYLEIKARRLATIKVGKRRLVRVEDETAYLAAHRQAA